MKVKSIGLYLSVSFFLVSLLTACNRNEKKYEVEALRVNTETVYADTANAVKAT